MNPKIIEYYDALASHYDKSRFQNSYGQFIDQQEKMLLKQILLDKTEAINLDMACGTGRFLDFAQYGIDISTEMLNIAQQRFPSHDLRHENAEQTPFDAEFFDHIMAFHLFMHLDKNTITTILDEVHRILKQSGLFIVDIPSAKRRKRLHPSNYQAEHWHGASSFSIDEFKALLGSQWKLTHYYGVLFLPIHRIPIRFRARLIPLDNVLCRSFLKEYSSYLICVIEKQ